MPDDKEKNETKEDDKKEFEITDFQEEKKYNEFIAYMEKTSKINQKVSLQVRRHWLRLLWNGFRTILRLLFISAFFWMISMFLSYIITVMLWWILGSVLSPERILPVTSSTITFVTYCIATSKKLWNSRKSVKLKILEVIDKKIDQKLEEASRKFNEDNPHLTSGFGEFQSIDKAVFMKIMFPVMLSYHMNASTAKSLPENVIGYYSEQMNSFKIKYETLLNLIGLFGNGFSNLDQPELNINTMFKNIIHYFVRRCTLLFFF